MAKFKLRTLLFAKKHMRDKVWRLTVKMGKYRLSTGFLTLSAIVFITG